MLHGRRRRAAFAGLTLTAAVAVGGTAVALAVDDGRPPERVRASGAPEPARAPEDRCRAAFAALPVEPGPAEVAAAEDEERRCIEAAVRAGELDPAVLESFLRADRRDRCAASRSLEDEAACRSRHVAAGDLEPFLLADLAYERCTRLVGQAVTACVEAEVAAGRIGPAELAALRCDDVYAGLPPDATEAQWAALAPAHAACVQAARG